MSENNGGIICGIDHNDVDKLFYKSIKYILCSDRVRGTNFFKTHII